ncbi:MAG: ATP-binding cassette domain-containing protein [Kiritimatiellaeota bacterium]|nr:ATP-binding cassette domain-containing protein [Kiritimatiellota bacterium]
MIRFNHVTKQFDGRKVLDDFSFEVAQGELLVLAGPSGTGKSVLLKHCVGLLRPDSGEIWVGGADIAQAGGKALEKIRSRFGYLFQNGALLGWMSVFENVALPLREKTRLGDGEIAARVNAALQKVGLENDGEKMPSEISGGMQKRAGLARAIVREPEIVLYDEPTSGLDPVTARSIERLIKTLNQQTGVTSVVVTHDLQGALSIGDRIALLSAGRIVECAPPAGFLASSAPEVRRFLDAQFIKELPTPNHP